MLTNYQNNPILLVEDNPLDLDLTLRAFAQQNITNPILVARDGEEALAFIPKWENGEPVPIVILLDINLPKVNGLEVLQILKVHPVFKVIPVVILTSSELSADVKTAYGSGTNSYIVKPVDFDKFIEVVKQIELYWTVLNKPA